MLTVALFEMVVDAGPVVGVVGENERLGLVIVAAERDRAAPPLMGPEMVPVAT